MLNLSGKCSWECQSSNSMRCAGAMSHHMAIPALPRRAMRASTQRLSGYNLRTMPYETGTSIGPDLTLSNTGIWHNIAPVPIGICSWRPQSPWLLVGVRDLATLRTSANKSRAPVMTALAPFPRRRFVRPAEALRKPTSGNGENDPGCVKTSSLLCVSARFAEAIDEAVH